MSFAIVEFVHSEEVEVVPTSWIDGDVCVWPGGKADRINRLLKASAEPQREWQQYAARVKGIFSSYENARKKLERAEFTSDLATTDDEQRRVVLKPKRFLSDTESDECSPPKRWRAAKRVNRMAEYPAVPHAFPAPSTSDAGMPVQSGIHTPAFPPTAACPTAASCPPMSTEASRNVITEAESQRQMLKALRLTRLMVEQVHDLLQNLSGSRVPETSRQPVLIARPFADMGSFLDFDRNVNEVKDQLLQELKTLAGSNVAATTKRILTYIMEDSVAQIYSWVGNKGKEKFRDLNVTAIIKYAVRANRVFSTTQDEIEGIVKKWRQRAPCRLKQLQERAAKKAQAS
ncbi:uncharacterized protein LOC144120230 [Amblyomma americanum]